MPYYAPPGGSLTALVARQLQNQSMSGMSGLGVVPVVNVNMPRAVPAALGAARRRRMQQQHIAPAVMTGMGMIRPPVRPPTPVLFNAALRQPTLSGLGAGGGARAAGPRAQGVMPVTAGTRRQAAMFMSPGGGYSQIPGYFPAIGPPMRRLSFFGQDDDGGIDTTMSPAGPLQLPDLTTPITVDLGPNAGTIWAMQNPQIAAGPVSTTPSPAGGLQLPAGSSRPPSIPNLLQPGQVWNPAAGAPMYLQPQPQSAALLPGVSNTTLLGVGAGVILLSLLAGGKRRR